jgi:hypothetical protein
MTYHRVCNQIYTTGATSGEGIVFDSGAHRFTPVLVGLLLLDPLFLSFIHMLCRSLFVLFCCHCVVCQLAIFGEKYNIFRES